MEHISIIYSAPTGTARIPYETFEDIKMTGILPANVLRLMQELPDAADTELRQKTFRSLCDGGTQELEKLSRQLYELSELYTAYDNAETDSVKKYIFAALLYRQFRFYKSASKLNCAEGFLLGFKVHFKELYDEAAAAEAERVYNALITSVNIEIKEDSLTLKQSGDKGYIADIRRCAAEMGIELSEPPFTHKEFGSDISLALSSLFSDSWKMLSDHYDSYRKLLDRDILDYIDQLDFYIYNTKLALEYTSHSIPICYAGFGEDISIAEGYDVTLMAKKCYDIIPNDITFCADKPVYFLAGANGGGKTTYLRTVGVCVILSLWGCPVPARHSRICRLTSVLTHFPRDERFELEGRLLDEQNRVEAILSDMGERSLILLNETYATTNEEKASKMTCELAQSLKNKGQFAVYVTHQKRAQETEIPMLCCVVDENDGGRRTYKIRPLNNAVRSHAEDILKKYSLSRADLEERFGI
ncbi:MAG: hypothetical protein IJA55_10330 [Clostridia bacterium]|nr:hypothetical protein [Clostridia bacterium]